MQRVEKFVGVLCVGVSAFMAWQAWLLDYSSSIGPGPGFFPFWLAVIFGGLSLSWLIAVLRRKEPGAARFLPERRGLIRMIVIAGAFAAAAALLNVVGYRLAMLAFVALTYLTLGGRNWLAALLLSFGLSFGVYYAFTEWLDVSLPHASVKLIMSLGL